MEYITLTVMGTTLFEVAARWVGDAGQWSDLAVLNGVGDPWIVELTTIRVPVSPG